MMPPRRLPRATPLVVALAVTLSGGVGTPFAATAGIEALPLAKSGAVVGDGVRGLYYVRHAAGRRAEVEQRLRARGGAPRDYLDRLSTHVVELPRAAVAALAGEAGVEQIEPVPEHRMMGQVVPWNVDQFQARDVWDKNRDGVVDAGAPNGAGVKVCIIDSGIHLSHSDFAGITITGEGEGTVGNWFEDGSGHGTHVAGTVNAMNNSRGVVGVLPGGAALHIVKVFNNTGSWGGGSLATAVYKCRNAGANVITMSLGSSSSVTSENNALQDVYDNNGILNVAAAGNDGNNIKSYPASYNSVVSVGAINEEYTAAEFSQTPVSSYDPLNPPANVHWDTVEFAGGGVQVLSTVPSPTGEVPNYSATADGVTHSGSRVEETPLGSATAALVNGGRCSSGSGSSAWSGKVVLCERGDVSFAVKINEVRSRGGAAVVIYNNVAGDFGATCGGNCTQPSIPSITVNQAKGQVLLGAVGATTAVVVDDGSGCVGCSGGYDFMSGTSMATPGVSSGMAFVWNACGGPSAVSNKQLRQLLRDSTRDLSGVQPADPSVSGDTAITYGAGVDRVTGWGLPQLADAMRLGNERFGGACPLGLEVSPRVVEVCGATQPSQAFTLTIGSQFEGTAQLAATGAPAGASAAYSVNPVTSPTKTSTYTLSNLAAVASGVYTIGFSATDAADAANRFDITADLSVHANFPNAPAGLLPASGSSDIVAKPTLSWNAATDASEYLLQVSTAADFSSIAYSATVIGTSHTLPSALQAGTTHYWRVRAANFCGDGGWSTTSSFTTATIVCELVTSSDVPKTLVDYSNSGGGTPGVTNSTLANSTVVGTLTDLNVVSLRGTHTYIQDLTFDLISPANTTVRIMARSCTSQDNFNLSLDDEADGSAGGWPCPPTSGLSYKPSNPLSAFDGQASNGTWTLRVTDSGKGDTGQLQGWGLNLCATPTAVNQAPVANAQSVTTAEDTAVPITLSGSDPEGAALTYAIASGPSNGALSGSGNARQYTPNANFNGSDSFSFTVNDGSLTSAAATVSITVSAVNDAPSFTSSAPTAATQGQLYSYAVTTQDVDAGASLTLTAPTRPAWLAFAAGASGGGTLSGTPGNDDVGSHNVVLRVSDGIAPAVEQAFVVTVANVNDAPTFASAPVTAATQGQAYLYTISAQDIDAGASLTISAPTRPGWLTFATAGGGSATLSGTPGNAEVGSHPVTLRVSDGIAAPVEQSFTVTVANVNDAPVLQPQAFQVADSAGNGSTVGTIAWSDVDAGDSHTLSITGGSGQAVFAVSQAGVITVSNAGALLLGSSFTLDVTVTDAGTLAASATMTITVDNTNDAPQVADQAFAIDERSANGSAVGSIVYSDPDSSDTHTVTVTGGTGQTAFAVSATGAITVANSAMMTAGASYTLAVTVTDGGGLFDTATVIITVSDVNDAPVIANQAFSVDEHSLAGAPVGTLVWTDPDAGDAHTVSLLGGTGQGVFAVSDAGAISVSDAGALTVGASFSLNVAVSDAAGATDDAVVTVTVANVNDAPTIENQQFTIDERSTNGSVAGTLVWSDPDLGDSHTISATGGAGLAAFGVGPTGVVSVIDSALLQAGSIHVIGVKVTDAGGLDDVGSLTVSVRNVPDAPSVADQGFVVASSASKGDLVGTLDFDDPDFGDSHVVTVTGGSGVGVFAVDADGRITVDDALALTIGASFTLGVRVTDGDGLFDDAQVTLSVTGNAAPQLADQALQTVAGLANGATVGTLFWSDADAGDTHTFVITGGSGQGLFGVSNAGVVSVASASPIVPGSYTLAVTLTDNGGQSAAATITIVVRAAAIFRNGFEGG